MRALVCSSSDGAVAKVTRPLAEASVPLSKDVREHEDALGTDLQLPPEMGRKTRTRAVEAS